MPKKKSALEIILTGIAMLVGAWAGLTIYQYIHDHQATTQLIDAMAVASTNQNKDLPKMVDSVTRLDSTSSGPGKVYRYHYTIMMTTPIDGATLVSKLRPDMVKAYRTSPDLATFRDNGVTMVYDYFDEKGSQLAEIQLGPPDLQP